jgi:hypothetical protein
MKCFKFTYINENDEVVIWYDNSLEFNISLNNFYKENGNKIKITSIEEVE